jgi:hypothetical protein
VLSLFRILHKTVSRLTGCLVVSLAKIFRCLDGRADEGIITEIYVSKYASLDVYYLHKSMAGGNWR